MLSCIYMILLAYRQQDMLFCNSDFTETVEMCQRNVYFDVNQTEYSIMQMKTTGYMREVIT